MPVERPVAEYLAHMSSKSEQLTISPPKDGPLINFRHEGTAPASFNVRAAECRIRPSRHVPGPHLLE